MAASLIVFLALLVAGCGGGGGDGGTSTAVASESAVGANASWTMPVELERESGKAEHPSVGMSANGDVVAVFAQQAGERLAVYAVHGNVNTERFGTPRLIDNPSTSAQRPLLSLGRTRPATQVATNPATGDAIAVWSASAGGIAHVWSARYVRASDAWSAPVQLDTNAAGATMPIVAMNAQGNAIAIWSEAASGEIPRGVSMAYFTHAAWSRPVRLSARTTGDAPQAGIDGSGNAIAAWTEKDASGADNVVAARIGSTGAVQGSTIVDASDAPASLPAVAVAPNGNALLSWVQSDGSNSSVHASRYTGSTWTAAQRIENLADESYAPAVALNNAGGFVAWEQQFSGGFTGHAYVARLNAANEWEAPVLVYNRGGYMPVVRMRDNGDAMMTWLAGHTQYARFSASTSRWSDVTNVSAYNCGSGHALAMDATSGKAFAAWIPSNCGRAYDLFGTFFK